MRITVLALLLTACGPGACEAQDPLGNNGINPSVTESNTVESGWVNQKPDWQNVSSATTGDALPELEAVLNRLPNQELPTPLLILPPKEGFEVVDLIPLQTGYSLLQKVGDVEVLVESSTSRFESAGKKFKVEIEETDGPRLVTFTHLNVDYAITVECEGDAQKSDLCQSDAELRKLANQARPYVAEARR